MSFLFNLFGAANTFPTHGYNILSSIRLAYYLWPFSEWETRNLKCKDKCLIIFWFISDSALFKVYLSLALLLLGQFRERFIPLLHAAICICMCSAWLLLLKQFFNAAVDAAKSICCSSERFIDGSLLDLANYRMAGNFRGVLIFVIFEVDSAATKISTHEN